MRTVSKGYNLHEMSNLFSGKYKIFFFILLSFPAVQYVIMITESTEKHVVS